jgi:hypothetical protein
MDTKTEKRQSVAGNRHWGGNTAELPNYEANAGHGIVVYAKFLSGCDPESVPGSIPEMWHRDPERFRDQVGISSAKSFRFQDQEKKIFEFRM